MTTTQTFLESGTWALDPAHSSIGFTVRHLVAAKVRGAFRSFSGTLEIGDSPEQTRVDVTIDASSIDSGVADRDTHLKSADFLDVERSPNLTFRSTRVRSTEAGFAVEGDLTIRGVTKPVTLDVEFAGVVGDPWGNEKAIFSAKTVIDREDWGLTWNAALETGGVLVGKQVTIEIEAQAAKD